MSRVAEASAEARAALRASMRARRAALRPETQREAAEALAERLSRAFPGAETIGVYAATQGELSLEAFIRASSQALRFAWPRTTGEGAMELAVAEIDALTPGKYGILTAKNAPVLAPRALDVMLIPGTAFSRDGGRLGMGGGYYDRYLAKVRPDCLRVGVGYQWQLVETLPLLPHDIRMTHLVSDKEYTPCTPPRSESERSLP